MDSLGASQCIDHFQYPTIGNLFFDLLIREGSCVCPVNNEGLDGCMFLAELLCSHEEEKIVLKSTGGKKSMDFNQENGNSVR